MAVVTTVLLHAIGLDRHQWDWCRGWSDVVAMDLPGHGAAPPLATEVTMAAVADHVAGQLSTLATGPVDLVGLSLGGMVAQHVLVRHRQLVRSAVLVCTKEAADPGDMVRRAEQTVAQGMAATAPSTLRRWFTDAALGQVDHPGVVYARQRWCDDDPTVVASYWRAMAGHDLRGALGAVQVPVTVVHGSQDVTSSIERARKFADLFPRSQLAVVDGPHLLCLEQPDALVRRVADHRAWVESGAEPVHFGAGR